MKIRVSMAGLVLAALPGLAACSADGGFAGEARDLPGVRDARVDKRALDTDYYGYTAIVDMEPGATRDQIAGALDLLADWKASEGNGGDDGVRLYLGAGTVALDEEGWGDGAHHDGPSAVIATAAGHRKNLSDADLLLRATDVLEKPVTVRGHEWAVTTDEPRETLAEVAKDRELAAAPGLFLAQALEEPGTDYWSTPTAFSSTEPLTPQHLAAYDRAVANARLVRQARAHVEFVGSETGVEPAVTDRHPGAITVRMSLRLPGMAGPKALAADPLADPRWPVVAAQVDLLRTLPRGSSLSVALEWGRAPEGGAGRYLWLVELSRGGRVHPKPLWNAEAAAYLTR